MIHFLANSDAAIQGGSAVVGVLGLVLLAVGFFLSLAMYLLPTIIAAVRGHRNTAPIVIINVLLGWTLLGWVAALVWSVVSDPVPTVIVQPSK